MSVSIGHQISEHCYWLGITDPYQVAIFSALSVKSEMVGNRENIIPEAVKRVDPAMGEKTFSKVHEAANKLVSHNLIKVIERPGRYLYYVNPKFWKRTAIVRHSLKETMNMAPLLLESKDSFSNVCGADRISLYLVCKNGDISAILTPILTIRIT